MKKRFQFSTPSPRIQFQPHFNYSVGQYVTSNRSFDEALKRKGDEASNHTGVHHDYIRLDPDSSGKQQAGVTDDG